MAACAAGRSHGAAPARLRVREAGHARARVRFAGAPRHRLARAAPAVAPGRLLRFLFGGAMPDALASSVLGRRVGSAYHDKIGGPGGWWIIGEPELHLGEDILVPDLAGWRRERMPDYPETAHVGLAPDWVCEVPSRRLELHGKRPVYAREGVPHLWLVDPADRALEAFELRDGQWVLAASAKDDDPICIRPFDAVTFRLGDLWP